MVPLVTFHNISRPNPSIDELEEASLAFCEIPWNDIYSSHQNNSHQMTSEEKLPNRCVEALYITTLLEDGFGFRGTHRGITLALEVDGTEVEWTLGFALVEECLEKTNAFENTDGAGTEDGAGAATNTTSETIKNIQQPIDQNNTFHFLQLSYRNSKKIISHQIKGIFNFTSLSITKVSTLLMNMLHVLSQRLHFMIQFLIMKPMHIITEKLIQFFIKCQQIIHKGTGMIQQSRLVSSFHRFLAFQRLKFSQTNTGSRTNSSSSSK